VGAWKRHEGCPGPPDDQRCYEYETALAGALDRELLIELTMQIGRQTDVLQRIADAVGRVERAIHLLANGG
jgi:hypothetical protein